MNFASSLAASARKNAPKAAAKGSDAAAALAAGRSYDPLGPKSLALLPLTATPGAVLAISGGTPVVWGGVTLWGVALGVPESVMQAAVADLTPVEVRGSTYGAFNAACGATWFAGCAATGLLYGRSPALAAVFAAGAGGASLPLPAAAVGAFGQAAVRQARADALGRAGGAPAPDTRP